MYFEFGEVEVVGFDLLDEVLYIVEGVVFCFCGCE